MASMSLHSSLLIPQVLSGLEYAENHREWVAVVCPTVEAKDATSRIAAALLPPGSSTTGRTTFLPGGGRLTVAAASEKSPRGVAALVFAGWGDAPSTAYDEMSVWKTSLRLTL